MTNEQAENVDSMEETNQQEVSEVTEATPDTGNPAVVDIDTLQAELEKTRQEAQINLEGWQRSRAEFSNYKRRTSQELADSRERGALDALSKVLPVLDDFERALNNVPDGLDGHPWVSGTALIIKNIQKVLDEYKVMVIDPVGQAFDPNLHEAIGMEDSDEYDSGIVTMTLQKGYRSGDRVLRPALVRVAS